MFVPKKFFILNFMRIFTDDQGTFCLVYAFYFNSCYNSNVLAQFGVSYFNSLNIVTKMSEGISSSETIRFLTLR